MSVLNLCGRCYYCIHDFLVVVSHFKNKHNLGVERDTASIIYSLSAFKKNRSIYNSKNAR